MANGLKPGDLVQLRSGGPIMTVDAVGDGGKVRCEWFDDKDVAQSKIFSATSLIKPDE